MRYFLDISYKGTNYHGWQIQDNAHTVQAELNKALKTILRKDIETVGSGRTDTGVHAKQQIVHLDTELDLSVFFHQHKLNKILPHDISINAIYVVNNDAHARFDAISRAYEYHISKEKNPFVNGLAFQTTFNYNIDSLIEMAEELKKHSDFECFSKVHTDVFTFNCEIYDSRWEFDEERWIYHIKANRFLRGMVRAIVGTMLDLAKNNKGINEFKEIIASKNRSFAGSAAPAEGLFLTEVKYPENLFIKKITE
jgi:tRNA pseudouridine38-40 synthase